MGRTADERHVHLLYERSICMPYLSHDSINKKQIRVESSMPRAVRHTRVIANKSLSIFMRIDGRTKKLKFQKEWKFLFNYSLFTKNISPNCVEHFSASFHQDVALWAPGGSKHYCLMELGRAPDWGVFNSSAGLRVTWDRCCCMTCHFHSPLKT